MPRERKVLVIGGHGFLGRHVASAFADAGAIRSLCRETNLDVNVVQEWGERLPFPDSSFDLVYCRQSLHHARDLPRLCREIGRVLRDGGTF